MSIQFDGQVAIITGSGRALGRVYAKEIARRGGAVVIADIGGVGSAGGPWADKVVAEIEAAGGRAVACHESIATSQGAQAAIDCAIGTYGRLDAMIHNAGFLRPNFIEDLTDDQIVDVIGVHLLGAFFLARSAWKVMKPQGYGRIVLVGSSALFGNSANSNYAAAKAGIIGLTNTLGMEAIGTGIAVNAIMPFAESDIENENPVPSPELAFCRDAVASMVGRRDPAWVSALVNYLASADCAVNGRIYSAFSGRYARVFAAIGGGWLSAEMPTAEDIGANIRTIDRTDDAIAPESMVEEIQSVHRTLVDARLI